MNNKIIIACALSLLTGNMCHAEDITIRFDGSKAKVKQQVKDSVTVEVNGAHVSIASAFQTHKLTVAVSGKSDDGQLILKTDGKAKVKLNKLDLTSQEGAPLWLKNKKKVEIEAANGTENTLTLTACNDTANNKSAVIWAKDKILLSGKGTLNIVATGDGCRGIKCKDNITIEDLTLNVTTSGNHLGEKPFSFGGFGGDMPDFGEGGFPDFGGGFPPMGGFGGFGAPADSTRQGGFPMGNFPMPDFGGGFPPMGGFGGFGAGEDGEEGGGMDFAKHKYVSPAKGIASKNIVTINSGHVTVTTNTPGAEGIEGKKGVILNGGDVNVTAIDDAINANAAIEFNGAHVVARSTTNDAVDANLVDFFAGGFGGFGGFGGGNNEQNNDPAIIITGGTVYAWSQRGMPEEGLDCDFSPIEVSGGKIFSVGAGMGEMPSVPTNDTAKQPTALLIGINIVKDEPVQICDANGTLLDTLTIPFSLKRSSSLITTPQFKVGNTYTVKTKDYEKTFTLSENFTVVR